ncbi:MAG TPA: DUF3597 domain-containing protein [Telluria sp.]|nr:DUF3597 domain-containing protein [Telluria sp.]
MSILSKIFHAIFPGARQGADEQPAQAATPQSVQTAQPGGMQSTARQTAASGQAIAPPPPAAAPMEQVDVEAILDRKAKSFGQPLNWRSSIVDLLKLLELDSSMQARIGLAHELDYKGDTNDSAAMNVWLHRQVMNRLAANGGKVPADLRD